MEIHGAGTMPNPALAIPEHRLICRVCEKQYSKYTCPQCNVRYCSLACYKTHSVRCTESFARSNVVEAMRNIQVSKESQQHMMEALKRVRMDEDGRSILDDEALGDEGVEDDDLDDAHGTIFSESTLKLIAEGGDISMDDLSVEERKRFLHALAAGEISHLIQPWNPWWLNPRAGTVSITKRGTSLIQLSNPANPANPSEERNRKLGRVDASEATSSEVPAPPSEALASIRQLIRGDPSPLIPVQLVEVIYNYCFTLKFCNGDWQSEPLEAALILLSASQVLDQAASPESVQMALADAVKTICSPIFKHAGGLKFAINLFDDCSAVLRLGRACVVCALADLHRMLESAKRDIKAELGAEKHVKHNLERKSGGLIEKNSSDFLKDKRTAVSGAIQNSSSRVGKEQGGEEITFADLRKLRDRKRGLQESKKPSGPENRNLNTSSTVSERGLQGSNKLGRPENRGLSSKSTAASTIPNEKKISAELRKTTAAIRKIYFLMCWTNEQPSEVFSSLALLVEAEKRRLLETDMTTNTGLGTMQESRAPVTKRGPFIEEIAEKRG